MSEGDLAAKLVDAGSLYRASLDRVLAGLDEEQRDAVLLSGGRSLVLAGPGSGKTTVITHKIAHLVFGGVPPSRIMLVTFTRQAAREMISRASALVGRAASEITAGTFHHVCNLWLRRFGPRIGLERNYSILDREDSLELIKAASKDALSEGADVPSGKVPSPSVIASVFTLSRGLGLGLEEVVGKSFNYLAECLPFLSKTMVLYEARKRKMNALDYDDLLVWTCRLLEKDDEVRGRLQEQFAWILVDEFQDTNALQLKLLELLFNGKNNLFVVADESQSIYSFRGARYQNVLDFASAPGCKVFKIQTNYRSTPEIVYLANHCIPNNVFGKRLRAVRPSGPRPLVVKTSDRHQEASFVASAVRDLLDEGFRLRDMAVLYRAHSHSMELQLELASLGIPFVVYSGPSLLEGAHIKDVMAFLRVKVNPQDEVSWLRVVKLFPGLGGATASKVASALSERKPSSLEEALSFVEEELLGGLEARRSTPMAAMLVALRGMLPLGTPAEVISYVRRAFYDEYLRFNFEDHRDRMMDLDRFEEFAAGYEDVEAFLSDVLLAEEISLRRRASAEDGDRITLSTVHQAKGLEWRVVFLISVNPGDFPSAYARTEEDLMEERRIFYVGITRARDVLVITRQGDSGFSFKGNRLVRVRGGVDFLEEIPPYAVEARDLSF